MNRRIIVLSLGITALFLFSFQASSQLNLIPQPLSVTLEEGSFRLSEKTK